MERYHIYKLGIAILFYAVYCRRPMVVNGLEIDDVIGTVNNKSSILDEFPTEEYFVFYQGVQGKPGIDFPVFSRIPRTTFSCSEVESGYYADLETDCQVFHICNEGAKVSFLCPNGTIFQQSDLICDWWFKVNCTNSPNLYEESAELLRESHLRRKASRRVHKPQVVFKDDNGQVVDPKKFSDRKMDLSSRGGRKLENYGKSSTPQHQKNLFAYREPSSSEEMQIPQETASFFKNKYNNIPQQDKNPYPNHRQTYSDIQDPKNYYTNTPSTSSISPVKTTFNNGRPFVVSTPKLGVYTTQRSKFVYSPTVPTTAKTTTTLKPTEIPSFNLYANLETSTQKSRKKIETFTNPPTITNGKSTTQRKPKTKNSFTIGLNSLQGSVPIKTQTTPRSIQATTKRNVFKLSLSSDRGGKFIKNGEIQDDQPLPLQINFNDQPPKISLENEAPSATSRPNSGFFITKTNTFRPAEFITSGFNSGSITGSKNTYIPTTRPPITTTERLRTYTEYHSNTFGFVKPTGVPKPKPFELPSTVYSPTTQAPYEPPGFDEFVNPTVIPNYQISSASPFTNVPPTLPSSYQTYSTTSRPEYTQPTYPTIYSAAQAFSTTKPLSEHVHNMIDTLKEIANVRIAKQEDFDNPRPGLIVPPSVGPQTLHTLAVYFANALDSLVEDNNNTETPTEFETTTRQVNENLIINSLLSMNTLNRYHELFKDSSDETTEHEDHDEDDNDLDREHSNNAVQSPRVRQLAKVFTQALSSYLDDPDMFRKVLQQIRPTEPPPLNTLPTENPEEDELLNFSDADIKPELPRLPTPPPANPTWGYILAFNNSDFKNNIDNNLGEPENLQGADSQSFIPSYNDIGARRDKSLKADEKVLENHWTSSPDATKLWQTTLYVNPLSINEKFETTDLPETSSKEDSGEILEEDSTQLPSGEENLLSSSAELSEFVTESEISYELHSLPKLELNSTQVHGILIDFMNSTKHDDSSKLQRILTKLNTTEDEFLTKMKQIEENPLTRRLILLLISECGQNGTSKADAVRDILSLANSNESLQLSSTNWNAVALRSQFNTENPPNSFTKLIDPNIKDDDQDSRALQLLNSLYSIASRYGK